MSNRISLIATKFTNIKTGHETLGYRLYDDYEQIYDNTFESVPDDDIEFLQMVYDRCDEYSAILNYLWETKKGININEEYYDWDEIKGVFE